MQTSHVKKGELVQERGACVMLDNSDSGSTIKLDDHKHCTVASSSQSSKGQDEAKVS